MLIIQWNNLSCADLDGVGVFSPPPKRKKLSINFPKILERIQKGIENTQKKINTKEEMHILKEKTGKQYKGYLITSFFM